MTVATVADSVLIVCAYQIRLLRCSTSSSIEPRKKSSSVQVIAALQVVVHPPAQLRNNAN